MVEGLKRLESEVADLKKTIVSKDDLEKTVKEQERKWEAFLAEHRRLVIASYSCFSKQKLSKR